MTFPEQEQRPATIPGVNRNVSLNVSDARFCVTPCTHDALRYCIAETERRTNRINVVSYFYPTGEVQALALSGVTNLVPREYPFSCEEYKQENRCPRNCIVSPEDLERAVKLLWLDR